MNCRETVFKTFLVTAGFAWAMSVPAFADYVTTNATGVPLSYYSSENDAGTEAVPEQTSGAIIYAPGIQSTPVSSGSGEQLDSSAVIYAPGVQSTPVSSGSWVQDERGWRYRLADGNEVCGDWYLDKGNWYYFEPDGYMTTGLRDIKGALYYFDPADGHMLSGTTVSLPDGRTITLSQDGSCSWPYKPVVQIPAEAEKSEEHHQLDQMCDEILAGISNSAMTDREKVTAIYGWIRNNVKYINRESGTDWVKEATDGIRSGRGDCFTHYAVSLALLSRCGKDCIQVIRSSDNNHYWVLVRMPEGWYHFDTTPRNGVSQWVCLLTDAQLKSLPHASAWTFDQSLYPRTP